MNHKKILFLIPVFSLVFLSACGKTEQQTSNTDNPNQEQSQKVDNNTQEQIRPSGTEDRQKGPGMDLSAAAQTLGVTQDALKIALGMDNISPDQAKPSGTPNKNGGQKIDFAAAAKTLGVTEDVLKAALGMDKIPSGTPPKDDQ
jgi:hypothetical protein